MGRHESGRWGLYRQGFYPVLLSALLFTDARVTLQKQDEVNP